LAACDNSENPGNIEALTIRDRRKGDELIFSWRLPLVKESMQLGVAFINTAQKENWMWFFQKLTQASK
jgi:hypothetical protein